MTLDQLFKLFEQARQATGHTEYVIIGSLSVLGLSADQPVPDDMTMSNDIDAYTRLDPGRIFDLGALLGEGSPFHARHGYYLDPVSPRLPTLPAGWEHRMTAAERDGLRLWFLDPSDAAISKYARGEPRDQRWIRAGILSGLVSLPAVRARLSTTRFLDEAESALARRRIDADTAWFADIETRRTGALRPAPRGSGRRRR